MDLLNQILEHPVDPDYAEVAARPGPRRRRPWAVAVVAVCCGAMFAVSALQTARSAPAVETERAQLIAQIEQRQRDQDQVRGQLTAQSAEVAALRERALGDGAAGQALQRRLAAAELHSGAAAVTGPGVVIVVADGPQDEESESGRIVDLDLQQLVNGLWQAGAEAITLNGHRLTATTAIRGAGDAVTVNYRSLASPYRVEAIGDPQRLQEGFTTGPGGQWWNYLRANYGMSLDLSQSRSLQLTGDPGQLTRHARGRS